MRVVLHGDVSCAARALHAVPGAQRPGLCRQIIAEAEAADRFFRRNGRAHAAWGNGSLMAAARKYPLADEPSFDNMDYCACVVMVLTALQADHASRQGAPSQPDAQLTQRRQAGSSSSRRSAIGSPQSSQ